MCSINSAIDTFLDHFRDKVAAIDKLNVESQHDTLQLLPYTAIIDTLAKTVSPPHLNDAQKFAHIIESFADWEHCNNISLVHLTKFFKKIPTPELEPLRKHCYSIIDTWDKNTNHTLDKDPDFDSINDKWKKLPLKNSFKDITLEHLQHKYLFYKFRCCLVHEFRPPGYGRCYPDDTEPCYRYSSISESMALCYPVLFCKKKCEIIIENLEKYYKDNRINPYDYFKYGAYWISSLNT